MSQATGPRRSGAFTELRRIVTNVAARHNEPPGVVRRRRIIVAITLVIGAAVMGLSMRRHPGESTFYWLTLTLAAVWAIGAVVSGPLHLGGVCWRGRNQRPVISGTVIGLLLGCIFVLGGLVVREIPVVSTLIVRVLQFASHGSLLLIVVIALVNGIAEEMFFRGALYTALGRFYPATVSTIVYIGAIMASGNPMLGFAAVFLGTACAWERRSTGGVLAPILTHLVWGLMMVLALPPLFGA